MSKPFRHYRDNRRDAASNLIGNCEGEHEVLATGRRMVSRGQNRAEVVTRVTETTWRHVAVEEIHIANEPCVVQRSLVRRSTAASD
jgi:hypothetical protein